MKIEMLREKAPLLLSPPTSISEGTTPSSNASGEHLSILSPFLSSFGGEIGSFLLERGIPLGSLIGEGAHLINVDLTYTSTALPSGDLGGPLERRGDLATLPLRGLLLDDGCDLREVLGGAFASTNVQGKATSKMADRLLAFTYGVILIFYGSPSSITCLFAYQSLYFGCWSFVRGRQISSLDPTKLG